MNQITSDPSGVSPENDSDRNFFLTVLTGISVLGLLITSIWDFAGFTINEQLFFLTHPHHGSYRLLSVVTILLEGKMQSMLAILFGAGMILLLEKKTFHGKLNGTDALMRRQIWLIILGLFVGLIILWPNDVLYPLGITGILVFAFWSLSPKKLLIAATVCMLIYAGKNFWNYTEDGTAYEKFVAIQKVEKKFKDDSAVRAKKATLTGIKDKKADSLAKKNDTLTSKQAEDKDKWEGMVKNLKYDSAKTANDRKKMREGYSKMWFTVKNKTQDKESNWMYKIGVWEYASGIFLGMALFGFGFFNRKYSTSKYVLFGFILLLLGAGLGLMRTHLNLLRIQDLGAYITKWCIPYNQFYPLEKLLIATGYISFFVGLLQSKILSGLFKTIYAVGKMPLSNYFLQVTIAAFWFYGYGLGFYGRFQPWELLVAWAQISIVQILCSVLWLRFYKYGPLEWALTCLINRKRVPNKINS